MKLPRTITIPQLLAIFVLAAVLFAATLSIAVGMKTDAHGNMSDCPLMSEKMSVCSMGVIEHIAKWQQLSIATFLKSDVVAFIILLLITFILIDVFARAPGISSPALVLHSPVTKNKPDIKLFNYLVIAFSQGILNPRIYA